jgi:heme O synthase-like polyprenyltransferase
MDGRTEEITNLSKRISGAERNLTMKSTAIAVLLPQLPSRSCLTAGLADFVSLMKPHVMSLAVFTALVGLLIAPDLHMQR